MKRTSNIIDIFVTIVDNYGDMGFAVELIEAMQYELGEKYEYIIWTDRIDSMRQFLHQSGTSEIAVSDIVDFGVGRASTLAILVLHANIPHLHLFANQALILRIDYLSLDPLWLLHNELFHIQSTDCRQIIEIIPSPMPTGAGLIPIRGRSLEESSTNKKHITFFTYLETQERIDWDSFPDDCLIYVFGKGETTRKNIIQCDFLPISEFYALLTSSEFVIIRGEVSFSHIIQTRVPFFWDMYRDIGGFPQEQSDQFLDLIGASAQYRKIHQILNGQKIGKISYSEFTAALSHTSFEPFCIHNLIHTVKKHIDRFDNSI